MVAHYEKKGKLVKIPAEGERQQVSGFTPMYFLGTVDQIFGDVSKHLDKAVQGK